MAPGKTQPPDATVAVVGAGDYIGAAIARRFAAGGFHVFAGRRHGDKLAPLQAEIEAAGGTMTGLTLDARQEPAITAFLQQADDTAPLQAVIFNVGGNVNFPLLETTERVFRKVWELSCYAGFLTGREAARLMLPRGQGSIFFTGATASVRGGAGYAAFAGAKHALRALAQSMARELGPEGIHVAHVVVDGAIDTDATRQRAGDKYEARKADQAILNPDSIAENYWMLHQQPRDAWTHELDLRPWAETW
jgi:NAD(P)-dependent dehydrogenase (short-subunit alcohol dehydrogenase family)